MKPNQPGIWEWFDEDGTKRLVEVFDVGTADWPYLRVYWLGGYYNVNDEVDDIYNLKGEVVEKNYIQKAEWSDRWGNRVADNGKIPDEQLYLGPTQEQLDKLRKNEQFKFPQ